jgi:DNA-binding Lrp family transcriptional regulator
MTTIADQAKQVRNIALRNALENIMSDGRWRTSSDLAIKTGATSKTCARILSMMVREGLLIKERVRGDKISMYRRKS